MPYNAQAVRESFHLREGRTYFDGGGGGPVLKAALDVHNDYIHRFGTVSPGGAGSTSREATTKIRANRETLAKLVNCDPEVLCYMPSATAAFRFLAESLYDNGIVSPGDHVVTTALDHESNVHPWRVRAGDKLHVVKFRKIDGALDMDDLEEIISSHHPKVVTFTLASNALGTVTDHRAIIDLAKRYRDDVIILGDAVHYAAHEPVDFQQGFDGLVVSMYKLGALHASLLAVNPELLSLTSKHKMPQIPASPLHYRAEQGNQAWANYAAAAAVVNWLNSLNGESEQVTREGVVSGFNSIAIHEHSLLPELLRGLQSLDATIYGSTATTSNVRVPTVAFTLNGHNSRDVAAHLDSKGMDVNASTFYANGVAAEYGFEIPGISHPTASRKGGMLRVSLASYHKQEDIHAFLENIGDFLNPHH